MECSQIQYRIHVEGMLPSLHYWKMLDALLKVANGCPSCFTSIESSIRQQS